MPINNQENTHAQDVVMQMSKVDSSWIAAIGIDESKGVVEMHLQSGAKYRYFDIPGFVFDEMLEAPSKGEYFGKHIRRAPYAYEKLN